MKADLVVARQRLQPADTRDARLFVTLGAAAGSSLPAARQAASAAPSSIACAAPLAQGPNEAGLGGSDDPADLRMPAGKGGMRAIDGRTVGPVLAIPGVVLGPADEIQQPSA
jgi:hypothetical protein